MAETLHTAVDVSETDTGYVITAEVPGVKVDDLSLTVAEGYLTLKGERKHEAHEEKAGYYRQERSYGSFQRIVAMPDAADLDAAKAEITHGVLTVNVPKKVAPKVEAKTIEIAHA